MGGATSEAPKSEAAGGPRMINKVTVTEETQHYKRKILNLIIKNYLKHEELNSTNQRTKNPWKESMKRMEKDFRKV